ncbi:MAG: iron-containing alcohol dehydrogenase, partial [Clostridia bacterium]
HGMEHPASGLKNLVHGRGLASITPIVMEKTVDAAKEKCTVISKALGGTDYTDCVAKINELLVALNLKITLGEQGMEEADVPWLVENFFKVSPAALANHPVTFTKEEIAEIFTLAL